MIVSGALRPGDRLPKESEPATPRTDTGQLDGPDAQLGVPGTEPPVEQLVAADPEFHRGIARRAGNSVLCSLLDGLAGPATRARI